MIDVQDENDEFVSEAVGVSAGVGLDWREVNFLQMDVHGFKPTPRALWETVEALQQVQDYNTSFLGRGLKARIFLDRNLMSPSVLRNAVFTPSCGKFLFVFPAAITSVMRVLGHLHTGAKEPPQSMFSCWPQL